MSRHRCLSRSMSSFKVERNARETEGRNVQSKVIIQLRIEKGISFRCGGRYPFLPVAGESDSF